MLNIILIAMVVFAIITVGTNVLRRAIIYSCAFSLLASFAYLLYKAPDVAIAEAVIGCTLSTILFLVALKKHKIYRVYISNFSYEMRERNLVINNLSNFALELELELDIINTTKSVSEIIKGSSYDVIIEKSKDKVIFHGEQSNYHFDDLIHYIENKNSYLMNYEYIYATDGED